MKKLIAFVLALVCVLGLVGCTDKQQNISEKDKNPLIYGETQEPPDNDMIQGKEEAIAVTGDYPAAIMVDDVVYYLSYAMPAEIDESAVVGYTTSYTDEMPQSNGEINFNRELNTPYARVSDGIAILYENEWWLCKP